MGKIFAIDRDDSQHELEGRERASLMEILRYAGLSVEALCSGCCQCATCHIYVEEAWLDKLNPPTEIETILLEDEAEDMVRANSRLSCQIQWNETLDGIKLTVAPEN
jgi:2Fe-2S ferredoxin